MVNGQYLLIVIDSHSKRIDAVPTKHITSSFVVKVMRTLFCRYGLEDVVSDKGNQFTSAEFKEFLCQNKVKHILIAPGDPSTNGQAENIVKTAKKCILARLKQDKETNLDLIVNRFFVDYRTAPHCVTNETPAQIFLGRNSKTRFSNPKTPFNQRKYNR